MNDTIPYLAHNRPPTVVEERETIGDGTYSVLATLEFEDKAYRLFADLIVKNAEAQLRMHRFNGANADEWFTEHKIQIVVSRPELAPIVNIVGAEFILCTPVQLNETKAAIVFGPSGPPQN